MLASAPQFDEVRFLRGLELGLLAAQPALSPGDLHAVAGAHPDQVGLEFGDHRENVEQQPPGRRPPTRLGRPGWMSVRVLLARSPMIALAAVKMLLGADGGAGDP